MIIGFDAKRIFHNASGLGNYGRDIVRILSNQFPENKYVLYNPKKPHINRISLTSNIFVAYPMHKIWKMFPSVWRYGPVSKQIFNDKIDVFHGLSNEIPRGINKSRTKVIVTIHDLIFIRFPNLYHAADRTIYRIKLKYALEKSDIILAISEQTKRDIINLFEVDENKIIVHYQGCHPAFKTIYSDDEKESVQKRLGLPSNYLLIVGTIEKRKNALIVLKAIKDMKIHCVIVGKPTGYKDELSVFIRENNMEGRIHFLKQVGVEDLSAIYQMANIFCYPSIYEGFGIPIIEALYSRVPVITSKGGCFSEAGGPDSMYVDPYNAEDWKNAICDLLKNEEKRKGMAKLGWQYVQKFNDEKIGESLMSIYQHLMN